MEGHVGKGVPWIETFGFGVLCTESDVVFVHRIRLSPLLDWNLTRAGLNFFKHLGDCFYDGRRISVRSPRCLVIVDTDGK